MNYPNDWLTIPMRRPGTEYRAFDGEQWITKTATGKEPAIKWKHMIDNQPPFGPPTWSTDHYGVGILLKPSNLLVIDCDSPEAVTEAVVNTPQGCNNIVLTRSGAHLYYRRPAHCPPLRTVQRGTSGKIDILADGYVVAPPSVHKSGFRYEWVRKGELQEAPDWACGFLMALEERQVTTITSHTPESVLSAPNILMGALNGLNPKCCDWAFGYAQPVDRSRALWLVMNTCIRADYSDESILRLIWYGPLGEKPRDRGWDWLCGELARARLELRP